MPLKTKVIVRNITNLSEARYCAGMGVDILSFPIGNDARGISIDQFQEIGEWVVGPQFALEFLEPVDEQILNVVTQAGKIEYIETTLDKLAILSNNGYKGNIILSLKPEELAQVQQHNLNLVTTIIADVPSGDLSSWESLNEKVPVLVDMSKGNHELQNILSSSLSGIALQGNEELASGNKTYDHLADILEALEAD
ncbi:MAG: hypothetical protein RLN86_11050 [Cyclobacteriaceae bacterium]